jgi:photosystem II stability/assembly factor-like uncharacterized protein
LGVIRNAALLAVVSGFVGVASGASASTAGQWHLASAKLESASFGVVVMSQTFECGHPARRGCQDFRTHVFVTGNDGAWREITPPKMLPFMDAVFLDPTHGWIVASDCSAAKGAVYRTEDGGRTWRSFAVGDSATCHAGSRLDLAFSDKKRGSILNVWGTANTPYWFLETVDGGATWARRGRTAPIAGSITAVQMGAVWLWRNDFAWPQQLYVTRDDGRTWRRRVLPPPAGWSGAKVFPDAPVFFGRQGVLPVTLTRNGRVGVAFYVTSDGGKTWRLRSVRAVEFPVLRRVSPFVRYVPTSIASPTTWWIAAGRKRPALAVSRDEGKSWQVSTPALPARSWTISAADSEHAWLTTFTRERTATFTSSNGGRTWERLRLPAS